MLDLREITKQIIEACKANEALNTFINSNYSKPLTYVIGVDLERQEARNDYEDVPQICIDPIVEVFGDGEEKKEHHVGIRLMVQHPKEEVDLYLQKENGVIEYKGVLEVFDFYRLFYQAIKGYDKLNCFEIKEVESLSSVIEFQSNNTEYIGQVKMVFTNDNEDHYIGCNS